MKSKPVQQTLNQGQFKPQQTVYEYECWIVRSNPLEGLPRLLGMLDEITRG